MSEKTLSERLNVFCAPTADELAELRAIEVKLEAMEHAARLARSALDNLMGDSDLDNDDSLEFKAMRALSRVLSDEDEKDRSLT